MRSEGADGAPVIDVTGLVFSDLPTGFVQEFRRRFRMVKVDSRRSYIDSVKVFPQNIEIRFSQTWTANPEDLKCIGVLQMSRNSRLFRDRI